MTTIKNNVAVKNGISLDVMVEVGPRGGVEKWYRASHKRDWQLATWSSTMAQAAK